ncbi:Hypp4481 [Branchiostoma lanceolatum]|uniref:Hypp4481 protein n=1 Tax=Branchiostoma lanceolatum TaxID=7740 RepID=A0A8K0AAJ9_BRALA|nr:Hypp4481 [Branchiostoma lanceolatum]
MKASASLYPSPKGEPAEGSLPKRRSETLASSTSHQTRGKERALVPLASRSDPHSSLPPRQGGAPTVALAPIAPPSRRSAGGEPGVPMPTRLAAGPGSPLGTLVGRLQCEPVVPYTLLNQRAAPSSLVED